MGRKEGRKGRRKEGKAGWLGLRQTFIAMAVMMMMMVVNVC